MAKNISFTIKFWRQNGPKDQGHFDTHEMHDIQCTISPMTPRSLRCSTS